MSSVGSNLSYTDLNAMQQLKSGKQANDPGTLRRVAQQFESLFLNVMVKSMRDANEVFAEGNPLNSSQTRFYQDMHDNQLTMHLAESQGIGLADVMVRQLNKDKGDKAPAAGPAAPAVDQSAMLARRRLAMVSRNPALLGEAPVADSKSAGNTPQPLIDGLPSKNEKFTAMGSAPASADWQPLRARLAAERLLPGSSSRVDNANAPQRFSSPQEFAANMLPMAERAAERLGIDPHWLVAQAALETGWGKSIIKGPQGSSHNLFGIKAHGGWQGESASVMTHEYRDGVKGAERASFRSYESFEQSFDDYVDFLQNNGRYRKALQVSGDPSAFFRELQAAGYATDPQYARKVNQIARQLLGDQRLAQQTAASGAEGRV